MHPQALATLQRYYAAFNDGDWAGMLAVLSDDVVHDINQGGSEHGREAFAAFLARMAVCYREHIDALVLWANADGGRAAAEYIVSGQYRRDDTGLPPAQGQSYRLPGGAFFTLHDGRITRVSNYYNLQEWLRQIGAPEAA